MAHHVQPASRRVQTVPKEVLVFPAGLDAIQSVVLKGSSAVSALPSATVGYAGKLGLLAGTVLRKVPGDTQNRYEEYSGTGTPEGVLTDNVYFESTSEDIPAAMFFHGCVFNKAKIKNYATYAAALATALPTCKFIDKTTPDGS